MHQNPTPTIKKPAVSYVNQESTHDEDDEIEDDDDDEYDNSGHHYYHTESANPQYRTTASYKPETLKYSNNVPTSYANSVIKPGKQYFSESTLNSPKYKTDEASSYVNRENEHSNSYSNGYSSPPKYSYSSESSVNNYKDPPKYKSQNDATSYVNRENEHSSKGYDSAKYSTPSKYSFSSSSTSYNDSPKYKTQKDAISYVNRENEHYEAHPYEDSDDNEDDDEEEYEYKPQPRYTTPTPTYTFKPRASRIPFTTKYTTPSPVYLHTEEIKPEISSNQFSIQHPIPGSVDTTALGDLAEDEEYVAIPIPKKSKPSPVVYPQVQTKTTYTYSDHIDTKPYDPAEHLESFDSSQLLDNYHKNKPSVSHLPAVQATKFTIEDVADPYKPKYTSVDYNVKEINKAPISIEEFQQKYNLNEGSLYGLDEDEGSNKELQKLLAKQEQFSTDHIRSQISKSKPSSLGQYQQYLKSQEDEKIEQQFLREQLKLQEQQQKRRPPPHYVRPFNKFHPGRRPPKRPSSSASYRTTIKIPYGFHFII